MSEFYYIIGNAYASKSTMLKLLAEKYDGILCEENYHNKMLDSLDKKEFPNLCYTRDLIVGYTDAFIKIALCQKGNSGYGAPLDISEYLTVSFEGILTPVTDNGDYYSIVVPKLSNNVEILSDNGVEITMPVIHCTVLTGEALEAKSEYYSNYEIIVTVELRNSQGNAYAPSIASNYVIYTNAKILPTYIDR